MLLLLLFLQFLVQLQVKGQQKGVGRREGGHQCPESKNLLSFVGPKMFVLQWLADGLLQRLMAQLCRRQFSLFRMSLLI